MGLFDFFRTIVNSPIRREIYEFTRGIEKFYYTSSDIDIQDGEITYQAVTLMRSDIESGSALEKNSVDITFALNSKFAQDSLRSALEENILVKISRVQFGNISTIWQGRVISVKPSGSEITLKCETDYTTIGRAGARYKYQRTCCHDVYGTGCKLNREDWAIQTTIKSIDKLNVEFRDLSVTDGYFNLGMLQDSFGVNVGIEQSAGQSVTTIRRLDSLENQITSDADLLTYNNEKQDLIDAQNLQNIAQVELDQAIADRDQYDPSSAEYAIAQLIVDDKQAVLDDLIAETQIAQDAFDLAAKNVFFVKLYAGCLKSLRACDEFGNTDNFLGFPYMPEDNPTTTRIV